MSSRLPLALFTVVYPGSLRFFRAWHESVALQSDQAFDLWIALDGVSPEELELLANGSLRSQWIHIRAGEDPVQLRWRSIVGIREQYDAVIFTDSDDILEPGRVAAAREGLRTADVVGCAMRIIDEDGADAGRIATCPPGLGFDGFLSTSNIFGLSNTAYSRRALSLLDAPPPGCVLMDWFLVTQVWGAGLPIAFGQSVGMRYRQYGRNIARIVPPFTPEQIVTASELVGRHYVLLENYQGRFRPEVRRRLQEAATSLEHFQSRVVADPPVLKEYCHTISALDHAWMWWEMVNYPWER